jgi:hypothetical protein
VNRQINTGAGGTRTSTRPTSAGLICPAPLEALCATLQQEIAIVTRRAAHGELASWLKSVYADLERALDAARKVELWVTVDRAASLSTKPPSTISRWCRLHGQAIGASKTGGTWTINWPKLEAFIAGEAQSAQREAA